MNTNPIRSYVAFGPAAGKRRFEEPSGTPGLRGRRPMETLGRGFLLVLALVFSLCTQPPASAMVLLSDNFNAENSGNIALNYAAFVNWDVLDGTVDLINTCCVNTSPGTGFGLFVDLDGSTSDAGKLQSKTTFNFPAGSYELKFDLAGNNRGAGPETVHVVLGSFFDVFITVQASDPFSLRTFNINVASPTSGKLSFENSGGDNVGALLDNVQLSRIPEPGTLLLLGSALAGFAAVALGRRHN
jgi:hypothetical protein